jgi:Flp pilus assembly protein TadG
MLKFKSSYLAPRLKDFCGDRGGNFAITTAILLPLLVAAAGVAIDTTNMIVTHSEMQGATDAAGLAAATALASGTTTVADAPALVKDLVAGQMSNFLGADTATLAAIKAGTTATVTPTTTSTSTSYAVVVNSSYSMPVTGFTSVLGWTSMPLAASSSTTSGTTTSRTALSMILALDQSGSMADNTDQSTTVCTWQFGNTCFLYSTTYVTKIAALKTAAAALFSALETADPTHVLVRTGAVSYNAAVVGQTKNPTMDWGTTAALKYVNSLPTVPTGGTDATGAQTIADAAVKKLANATDPESISQLQKGNSNATRFIVLMSDGEMTGNSSNWNQSIDLAVRANCDSEKKTDGITIFTVAFMAPADGQALLKYCASTAANYYSPNTMADLVSAFTSIAKTATQSMTLMTR